MSRVALIAPEHRVRAMLVALAESGSAQLVGPLPAAEGEAVDALRRLERAHPEVAKAAPRVAEAPTTSPRWRTPGSAICSPARSSWLAAPARPCAAARSPRCWHGCPAMSFRR